MGYHGGAPPWVYKNEIAHLQSQNSSNVSEMDRLKDRVKELEEENARLKNELEQCKKTSGNKPRKRH
jgi:hypothetical protein